MTVCLRRPDRLAFARQPPIEADAALASFYRPALIAWANEDRVFPYRHAERLAQTLPNAELLAIAGSYTYIPEDQPLILARHIDAFIERIESAGTDASASS